MSDTPGIEAIEEHLRSAGVDLTLGEDGELTSGEIFWRDHQPWLKERGYTLRERYQPDWVPSWKSDPRKSWMTAEDGVYAVNARVLDATRTDGSFVVLKRINIAEHPDEPTIGRMLSSEPLISHPANHCAPVLEVLDVPNDPGTKILVIPFLQPVEFPPFETIGEVVEFFRQIFGALNFMHENHIAHRDIKYNNVMADTLHLYDPPPHPSDRRRGRNLLSYPRIVSSRTQTPVKYYLIDYGLSKAYKSEEAPFLEFPAGGDKTVPEFQEAGDNKFDPFPVDVYCMGNIVRRYFLEGFLHHRPRKGFEFMRELVQDMVKDDPQQRPTMSEVVSRYDDIMKGLSNRKLRSRVSEVGEHPIPGLFRSAVHWVKQASFMIKGIPPIPKP